MNIIEGERLYGPPSPPLSCTRGLLGVHGYHVHFISHFVPKYPLRSMATKSDFLFRDTEFGLSPYNLSPSMIFMEYPSNFVSSLLVQWFIPFHIISGGDYMETSKFGPKIALKTKDLP